MFREFAAYYRPHMGLFWVDFGCAVLSGLLELAFPLAVTGFIDYLLPRGDWPLTLATAAGVCHEQKITERLLSDETIRQAIRRLGVGWKRAKTWITSPDPAYLRKKRRATG